ncbi:hypothetical protein JL722_3690 [Aureococcus anophagefferens]|nr:hypothetical protein JL722_3690 [Aureococcus anophagefferens]
MGCHRAAPAALAFVAGIFAAVVVFQAQHVSMHGAAPPAAAPPLAAAAAAEGAAAASRGGGGAAARGRPGGPAWPGATRGAGGSQRHRRRCPRTLRAGPRASPRPAPSRGGPARSVEAASTRAPRRRSGGRAARPRDDRPSARGPTRPGARARCERGARRWPAVPRSCRAYHPRTVIYNRIPKCGSGSVNIFLTAAEERNAYQFCRSTRGRAAAAPRRARAPAGSTRCASSRARTSARPTRGTSAPGAAPRPPPRDAAQVFAASSCRRKIDGAKPAVLNRHVFFYDFGDRTAPPLAPAAPRPPARAPTAGPGRRASRRAELVSRCVSRFYYERDARGTVAADVALRVEINQ